MSGLFSSPSVPTPPPPPEPPEKSDVDVQEAALQERLRRARQRGRAANILTGNQGVTGDAPVARKTLLGE